MFESIAEPSGSGRQNSVHHYNAQTFRWFSYGGKSKAGSEEPSSPLPAYFGVNDESEVVAECDAYGVHAAGEVFVAADHVGHFERAGNAEVYVLVGEAYAYIP